MLVGRLFFFSLRSWSAANGLADACFGENFDESGFSFSSCIVMGFEDLFELVAVPEVEAGLDFSASEDGLCRRAISAMSKVLEFCVTVVLVS